MEFAWIYVFMNRHLQMWNEIVTTEPVLHIQPRSLDFFPFLNLGKRKGKSPGNEVVAHSHITKPYAKYTV